MTARPTAAARRAARLAGLAVVALLLGCGDGDAPAGDARPSSLILVTLDTTRADHTSPYGADFAATPTLASLAAGGALFECAYAVAPTTLPAHATLLTGVEPMAHGVRQNGLHRLRPEATTLAEVLAAEGFATAAFVSAAVLARRAGLDQGFAVYDDATTNVRHEVGRVDERLAGETVAAARRWLDARSPGERFLLWVHLFDPHAEYRPPPPYAARFAARPYDGEIAYMDAALGELLAHPRARERDVLVMAIGDHGESLGEHGEAKHGLLLYDATLHVPWIVAGPGVASGRRLAAPAGQVDLLPTALDLLGVPGPADAPLAGRSWAAALAGEGDAAPAERQLYAETFFPLFTYGWAPLRSLREGAWKLVEAPRPELYDLAADPGERTDVFAANRRVGHRLRQELLARIAADAGPAPAEDVDSETARQLEALGYVATSAAGEDRVRPDPKDVIDLHPLVGEAVDALHALDTRRAIALLRRVLERDPHNLSALERLGLALAVDGRTGDAVATLERALALDPASHDLRLVLAHVHTVGGDPARGLELAEEVVARAPDKADAHVERGLALAHLGRAEEAAPSLARALELDPENAPAAIAYAEHVELARGDADAASARLARLAEREAARPEIWRVLGLAHEAAGRPAEAEAAYRRGLAERPLAGILHAHLGVVLAGRGDPEAERHLARAAELLDPVPALVHLGHARLAVARGDWAEVAAAAERALAVDDRAASGWNLLAAAREERGDAAGALRAYDAARRADPRHVPALFNRALLLRRLGRHPEAADQLREVIALEPRHAAAHYELGVLYGGPLADGGQARRHLEQALALGYPRRDAVERLLDALGPVASVSSR